MNDVTTPVKAPRAKRGTITMVLPAAQVAEICLAHVRSQFPGCDVAVPTPTWGLTATITKRRQRKPKGA